MKSKLALLGAITLLFAACTEELQQPDNQAWGGVVKTPLSISVTNQTLTKAKVDGTSMPEGAEIGVFLRAMDGSNYEGKAFNNTNYTAAGTESAQTWIMDLENPIGLTATTGKAFAYYPWQSGTFTEPIIPISNDGTDWMYAVAPATNLSNGNPNAQFEMTHAMTIIRCKLVKGTYIDPGVVTNLSVRSTTLATQANMDLTQSKLTTFAGTNTPISQTITGTLSAEPIAVESWAIPTGTTGQLMFSVTVDGTEYIAYTPAQTTAQGNVYNYTLTVNSEMLDVTEVSVDPWNEINQEDLRPAYDAWGIAKQTDGVYAIDTNGNPVPYDEVGDGTYKGVAFVVNGKAYQVAKTDATGYGGSTYDVNWWYNYKDVTTLNNIETVDGTEGLYYGNLAGSGTPQLSKIPSQWTGGALADFNGQENTRLIIEAQGNGTTDKTLGKAVMDFRGNPTVNEGQTDWYAPACGQLAFMFLKQTELNELLSKVSGTQFSSGYYWSSSECNSKYAWNVNFSYGYVNNYYKDSNYRLRLVRAI